MLVLVFVVNKGAILLLRREMRRQILFNVAGFVLCSYMKEQLLLHEGAITPTCRSNKHNCIYPTTRLMK